MGCFPPILNITDYRILSTVVLIALAVTVLVLLVAAEERSRKWVYFFRKIDLLETQNAHFRRILSASLLTVIPFLPASNLLVTVGFTVAERYVPRFFPSRLDDSGYCTCHRSVAAYCCLLLLTRYEQDYINR